MFAEGVKYRERDDPFELRREDCHLVSVACSVFEHQLKSWTEFLSLVEKKFEHSPGYIYRGQADANWKLESALDRLMSRFPMTKNYHTNHPKFFDCPPASPKLHLEAFKECVRGKRGQNPANLLENEWWALAQHHGLATPLLDWAYSPFVALYFAFEDQGYVDWANHELKVPAERAVYAASFHLITENGTDEIPAPTVFSPRREITGRLSSQSGVLMKMPSGCDLEKSVKARFQDSSPDADDQFGAVLTKITMPNDGRVDCLKLLNKMNINRMSLFPDLDGAARYINSLWELDFPTALGRVPDGSTEVKEEALKE
jgi:hypothetical protein